MLAALAITGRPLPRAVLLLDVLLLLKLLLPDSDLDMDLREGCVTVPATTSLSAVVRLLGTGTAGLFG